jgi:hypothetical protein
MVKAKERNSLTNNRQNVSGKPYCADVLAGFHFVMSQANENPTIPARFADRGCDETR